ncbi:uncharacterized protein C8Q71DRAFT_64220 [Rhodofomes roseus]|uniref:Uncharacterized protein n=1 Tax=Rhodofomes roseus TaxID=34475 RepID=A0ABQ8KFJ0_9APHY|nr:uncharacterized protein C8Q71DRAFT_64220 [Rhodofomes roseus]KAH9836056.1 hypothetical protein C8Q71DRAFT_64220 [Rhodofomes roseus]
MLPLPGGLIAGRHLGPRTTDSGRSGTFPFPYILSMSSTIGDARPFRGGLWSRRASTPPPCSCQQCVCRNGAAQAWFGPWSRTARGLRGDRGGFSARSRGREASLLLLARRIVADARGLDSDRAQGDIVGQDKTTPTTLDPDGRDGARARRSFGSLLTLCRPRCVRASKANRVAYVRRAAICGVHCEQSSHRCVLSASMDYSISNLECKMQFHGNLGYQALPLAAPSLASQDMRCPQRERGRKSSRTSFAVEARRRDRTVIQVARDNPDLPRSSSPGLKGQLGCLTLPSAQCSFVVGPQAGLARPRPPACPPRTLHCPADCPGRRICLWVWARPAWRDATPIAVRPPLTDNRALCPVSCVSARRRQRCSKPQWVRNTPVLAPGSQLHEHPRITIQPRTIQTRATPR